jgi:hypothetical protein
MSIGADEAYRTRSPRMRSATLPLCHFEGGAARNPPFGRNHGAD